jgi:hypothetical protein
MIKQWARIEDKLDALMASYTSPSVSLSLNLGQKLVQMQNNFANNMPKSVNMISNTTALSQGLVVLSSSSSFCQLINSSLPSYSSINCSSVSLIQKTALSQVAIVGDNGRACNIDSSLSVTLSFFQASSQKLDVKNLASPISVWIPRSNKLGVINYQSVAASSLASIQCVYNDVFLQNSFTMNGNKNSIHVQFKPTVSSVATKIGYLVLLKFGSAPKLNSTISNYDLWELYCPNDTKTQLGDAFFLMFANMNTVNGFKGYVGVALRELTSAEFGMYCLNGVNRYNGTTPPILDATDTTSSTNVTTNSSSNCKMISNDLSFRVFLSGCYYMDTDTGSYSSYGTEVMPDTNLHSTHCEVSHCTEFAGGFIVLPATINFEDVFANASITQNPIIYATVITIIGIYIILAVVCRVFDVRDKQKKGLTLLNEGMENMYEIIVFTGNRQHAGTDSRVSMIINGELDRSHVIELQDTKRKSFRRGGVDTFIISTEKYV